MPHITPDMARQVHAFWFDTLSPKQWFSQDDALDRHIAAQFGSLVPIARDGSLADWRITPTGRLAEIIVLDQFSRNIYRDTAEAFAGDSLACKLAAEAVDSGADDALSTEERIFLYMPFMHSESLADHDRARQLFDQPGMEQQQDFEQRHRVIIERFGRYPHRNTALGRESTAEEQAFLEQPGSSF